MHRFQLRTATAATWGLLLAVSAPAAAHPHDGPQPEWNERDWRGAHETVRPQFDPAAREEWLADCRERSAARDSGVGGAVIGGVAGGLAGNRIAGRHHRTVGTIAGAAVGAAAGAAIDRAEDARHSRDECEAYLEDYYARYYGGYGPAAAYPGYAPYGYGYPGYAPAYAPAYGYTTGCCMAPVMMVPSPARSEPECTETIEYVYEDVPIRRKARPRPISDKRIRIAPDKRIKTK